MIYEFKCLNCKKEFVIEYEHFIKEGNLDITCPHCFEHTVTKLISIPTIIYKDKDFTLYKEKDV